MSKQEYPYPQDEFDVLGQERVPHGVHREPTPRWRVWLPYLLVIVLVPLLTFGAVKYFTTTDDGPGETPPTATGSPTGDGTEPSPSAETGTGEEPTDEPSQEPSEEPTDEPTDEPTTPDLDLSVPVLVLNGAAVQGLAGRTTDFLTDQGWTAVTASNYSNAAPTETTLYYHSADIEAEAEAVAEQLGITALTESAEAASNGIVIVLRSDFTEPAAD